MLQIYLNGEPRQFEGIETVAELITVLELMGKRIAVEKNASIVPFSRYSNERLENGDKLEIVVAVGGG